LYLNKCWICFSNIWYSLHSLNYLFFVVFTDARSPRDYCNNIESPPPYLVSVDQNGMPQLDKNIWYNQSFASTVNQKKPSNINEQFAFSSGVDNGKGLNFD